MKRIALLGALLLVGVVAEVYASNDEITVQYTTGAGMVPVPCLGAGDQIGVVFDLPPNEYPIEVTEIAIGWGSVLGNGGSTVEDAIRIYAGTPDSGPPIFVLSSPRLYDGVTNVFRLDPLPGAVPVASGPFVVTLAIAEGARGSKDIPTAVHDGFGIHAGRNLLFSSSAGWQDAVQAGLTGDWGIRIKYRSRNGVVAHVTPAYRSYTALPWSQTDSSIAYVVNAGTDTLRISGITGGYPGSAWFDTSATGHSVAPGDSTRLAVMVKANVSTTYTTAIRVYSNAKNSPSSITIFYAPQLPTGVGEQPVGLHVTAVVPNPFNPVTTIHFDVPEAGPVDADVFAVNGAHVRTLADDMMQSPGPHELTWDGRNDRGSVAASGVYYLRLRTQRAQSTARLVLLK